MSTHHDYARCLRHLGETDRALTHLRGLAAAGVAVMGPQQIDAPAIRAELVSAPLEAGEDTGALRELWSLEEDSSVLDPGDVLREWIDEQLRKLVGDRDAGDSPLRAAGATAPRQQNAEELLPFSVNRRLLGGPTDGEPGEPIVAIISDIVPSSVIMVRVEDDGYLPDEFMPELPGSGASGGSS